MYYWCLISIGYGDNTQNRVSVLPRWQLWKRSLYFAISVSVLKCAQRHAPRSLGAHGGNARNRCGVLHLHQARAHECFYAYFQGAMWLPEAQMQNQNGLKLKTGRMKWVGSEINLIQQRLGQKVFAILFILSVHRIQQHPAGILLSSSSFFFFLVLLLRAAASSSCISLLLCCCSSSCISLLQHCCFFQQLGVAASSLSAPHFTRASALCFALRINT